MSTWDCVIGYVAVDLYWGSCGREWVSTGDGVVD